MEELFGEEENFCAMEDDPMQFAPKNPPNHNSHLSPLGQEQVEDDFFIEEEAPGPMDLLPSKMPVIPPPKPKAAPIVHHYAQLIKRRASGIPAFGQAFFFVVPFNGCLRRILPVHSIGAGGIFYYTFYLLVMLLQQGINYFAQFFKAFTF